MLKLIQVEFLKLRRRRFIWMMLLAALFMPFLALFYFKRGTGVDPVRFYNWTALSYTTWIVLPVVLGMFCTMLMYDEDQYDMLKQLWIIPVSKMGYFLSKFATALIFSICFMLITATASVVFGALPGYFAFEWNTTLFLLKKCLAIGVLTAFAILPVLTVAAAQKRYILPVCVTLVYTFLGFILLMVNMYLHPLSGVTVIVNYDIPGVIFRQAINLPLAFLCIGVWDAASALLAYIALARKAS